MRRLFVAVFIVILAVGLAFAEGGVKKKRPLPYDYGKVVINNYSEKAFIAPVVFDHWIHRARFTCRVCHIDVGFGMKAGETNIRAADNIAGFYCGACHNGKMEIEGRKVFKACSKTPLKEDSDRCERCHSLGRRPVRETDFNKFVEKLPKERFGNGVNWEKAEEDGLIKPSDYVEGVSIKRQQLAVQKDFSLVPKVEGMPNIIFSHKKHTVWNGCELCHPDIFFGVKKGATHYTMVEIFQGKYCGACHTSVAFPLTDCQRCHIAPVGQAGE